MPSPFHIRPATPDDHDALLAIWLRSVRATHGFLTEADIQELLPLVRDGALPALELWVLARDDQPVGFIGLDGSKLEAMFLDPAHFRGGGGRMLVEHARRLKGPLTVDVNEQQPDALRFYLAVGFRVVGRSEVDSAGRPFPLLHLSEAPHYMPEILASTFVLAVNDLEASRRFYVTKLGFVEDFRVDGWAFLNRGACKLRLGHCPDAVPMSKAPDHSWFAYLHVRDATGLYAEAVSNGVEIWHPLADKPWGMREFAVVSPDGHRIVFGEARPVPQ